MITEIVAVAYNEKNSKSKYNWGIGKKNGLLFNIPADMKHFKAYTTGKIVILGEKTLLSFPNHKPLPDRLHIVLCEKGHNYEGCVCVNTLEECLQVIKENTITPETEFVVIGGGMCYKSFLEYADKLVITKVDAEDKEATVFFPNVDNDKGFKLVKESETIKDNNYNIKFCEYERVK